MASLLLGIISSIAAPVAAVTSTVATIREMGYSVCLGIEIENWTKYPLTEPIIRRCKGYVNSPPSRIPPGKNTTMEVRKTGFIWAGSYGTVSWKVATGDPKADRRVVVMWGMPYNHNHYSNTLAVGLTNPGETKHREDNDWLNLMLYDKKPKDKVIKKKSEASTGPVNFDYQRGEYYFSTEEIEEGDDKFEVVGYMGSTHQTDAKIIFRPKFTNPNVSTASTQLLNKDHKSLEDYKVILADYAPRIRKGVLEWAESEMEK
ncbi:tereporin-Ca1-like [Amphiura filiformis]|uniref:tereporin-Ca1-like n=1 Tax=Amphiura filiformis TaxID=82378 RepID=UPI003B20B7DE